MLKRRGAESAELKLRTETLRASRLCVLIQPQGYISVSNWRVAKGAKGSERGELLVYLWERARTSILLLLQVKRFIQVEVAVAQEVRFLLFDVESVADGDLINTTKYAGEGLSSAEAILKFRQELLMTSSRDFIPYTYHLPVAVVIAKIRADYSLLDIVSLDQPHHRPHVITKHFWTGWEAYERPTWVTFNGRTFDLPLMEHAAFRFGVALPQWFNLDARTYDQYRNRYNLHSHLDLHELLTNFGSTWFRGGLNLAAALLGKPGKMSVQGDMVQSLYDQGKISEINEYCRCDVLDTYFVFLRMSTLMGKITLADEQDRVRSAKELIESQAAQHPAYQQYLEQWGDWSNPWGEEIVATKS